MLAERLANCLERRFGKHEYMASVDAAPVPEKAMAIAAGLGTAAPNSMTRVFGLGCSAHLGVLFTSLDLARAIHERTGKSIWCYTGFTFEALLNMPSQRRLLQLCDVLVDGPYVERLHDPDLLFRGSTNQRIIDVAASLLQNQVVLWHDPMSLAS